MTGAPPEGAVVLDTMVMSWLLDGPTRSPTGTED